MWIIKPSTFIFCKFVILICFKLLKLITVQRWLGHDWSQNTYRLCVNECIHVPTCTCSYSHYLWSLWGSQNGHLHPQKQQTLLESGLVLNTSLKWTWESQRNYLLQEWGKKRQHDAETLCQRARKTLKNVGHIKGIEGCLTKAGTTWASKY